MMRENSKSARHPPRMDPAGPEMDALDEALAASFPCSDPPAIASVARVGKPRRARLTDAAPSLDSPQDERLPRLVVSDVDRDLLTGLARSAQDRDPDVADELLSEMERADIVASAAVPADVVRMGSTVAFRSDDGRQRRITLVLPNEADIAAGRISVLTPIGAALIGLSEGHSIMWTARDGRRQRLTILSVEEASGRRAEA